MTPFVWKRICWLFQPITRLRALGSRMVVLGCSSRPLIRWIAGVCVNQRSVSFLRFRKTLVCSGPHRGHLGTEVVLGEPFHRPANFAQTQQKHGHAYKWTGLLLLHQNMGGALWSSGRKVSKPISPHVSASTSAYISDRHMFMCAVARPVVYPRTNASCICTHVCVCVCVSSVIAREYAAAAVVSLKLRHYGLLCE